MTKRIEPVPEFKAIVFRRVEPLPQWSARIVLDVPYAAFLPAILSAAGAIQHRYTGTLTRDPTTGNVTSFTHTRFRRNKYGKPPTVAACKAAMGTLANQFDTTYERDLLVPGLSRAVLGLYEGQHASGMRAEQAPDYSVQDVGQALGGGHEVSEAELCSVRFDKDGTPSHYAEKVAQVTFPTTLQGVHLVAHAMRQERFSVEEFGERKGLSYMVETQWCQEPDPLRPVI